MRSYNWWWKTKMLLASSWMIPALWLAIAYVWVDSIAYAYKHRNDP